LLTFFWGIRVGILTGLQAGMQPFLWKGRGILYESKPGTDLQKSGNNEKKCAGRTHILHGDSPAKGQVEKADFYFFILAPTGALAGVPSGLLAVVRGRV
jgi:hypothetical protein